MKSHQRLLALVVVLSLKATVAEFGSLIRDSDSMEVSPIIVPSAGTNPGLSNEYVFASYDVDLVTPANALHTVAYKFNGVSDAGAITFVNIPAASISTTSGVVVLEEDPWLQINCVHNQNAEHGASVSLATNNGRELFGWTMNEWIINTDLTISNNCCNCR